MHPARLVPSRPSRRLSSLRAFHFRGLLHRVPRLPGLEASVEGRCLEAQLVQPAAASLLVALEHFLVPYSSLVPVVASFAKHPALPRGVPTPVEVHLELAKPLVLLVNQLRCAA